MSETEDRLRDALARISRFAGRLDEEDADVIWEIVYHALKPEVAASPEALDLRHASGGRLLSDDEIQEMERERGHRL